MTGNNMFSNPTTKDAFSLHITLHNNEQNQNKTQQIKSGQIKSRWFHRIIIQENNEPAGAV